MKLYVVGVGPGDPELLTIKAKKILEDSETLFCPKGGKESIALSIVEKVVDIKNKRLVFLDFPMVKTKDEKQSKNLKDTWENLAKKMLTEMTIVSSFDGFFYKFYCFIKFFDRNDPIFYFIVYIIPFKYFN